MVGCANKEEAQKYQLMASETAKLISQTELVIKDQRAKADSLRKIQNDYIVRHITTLDNYNLHNEIINTIDVESAMSSLQLKLGSIKLYSTILEKANKRFSYLFKGKRSIKRMYTKLIYDTNSEINDITGGLSAKEYIYKYIPKDLT